MQRKISDFGMYPSWSPDGSQILFQSMAFGVPCKVFVVGVQGGEPQEVLAGIGARMQVMSAGWHPDGRRVTVWGWTAKTSPLPTFWTGTVIAGGELIRTEITPEILKIAEAVAGTGIGPWADGDFKFTWAPTGRAIYFERSFRGAKNIWRMSVNPETLRATGIERPTTGSEGESEFALSRDGSKLAFTSANEQVRAWVFPFDPVRGQVTGDGQAVTSPGLEAWEGSLSPDGTKLAFMGKRAGKWELREKSLVDGSETPILAEDMYVRNEPQWSPDGSRLAYVRQNPVSVEQQLVVWDTQKRSERAITELTRQFLLVFDWSPDGKWLVASEQNVQGNQTDVWIEPATGRRAEPSAARKVVTAEPNSDIWQGRISPNGDWVVFEPVKSVPRGVESSIEVAPVAGGKWIHVTEGRHWDDKPRWSPDGRAIYFLSERSGYFNVFGVRFDPAGGRRSVIFFRSHNFTIPA
jgi:Tol biopolymer transport system component